MENFSSMPQETSNSVFRNYLAVQSILFPCYFLFVLPAILSKQVLGEGIDLFGTLWFYWWVDPSAIGGQQVSNLFFFPFEKDIFAHTGSNIIDAYLSIPFQWVFGFPTYQPFFILFLFLLNSISLQRWFSLYTSHTYILIFTILTTLFSPFFLWELSCGRMTQFVIFPAILALDAMERLRIEGKWKWAVLAGFFAGLQGWVYWFYGYFLGFFLLYYVLLYARAFWNQKQSKNVILAFLTCLFMVVPAVVMMFSKWKQQQIPGLDQKPVQELLFSYTPWEPMGIPFFSFVSISISLVVLFFIPSEKIQSKSKIQKLLLGWVVISLLICCGDKGVLGERNIDFVHYIWLREYLPFFSRLWFPYRMLAFTQIALGLGWIVFLRPNHLQFLWIVLGLHVLQLYDYRMLPVVQTAIYEGGVYEKETINAAILELPIGFAKPTIAHQILHQQPVFGGMGENISMLQPKEHQKRLLQNPYKKMRSLKGIQSIEKEDIQFLIDDGFGFLTVDKSVLYGVLRNKEGEYDMWIENLFVQLGQPCASDDILILWNLQGDCQSTQEYSLPDLQNVLPIVPSSFEKRLQEKQRIPH